MLFVVNVNQFRFGDVYRQLVYRYMVAGQAKFNLNAILEITVGLYLFPDNFFNTEIYTLIHLIVTCRVHIMFGSILSVLNICIQIKVV